MTKFKVKPFTDYEKRRQMMELIEQYMKDSLVKVDAEKALIVLANHKPIWTVDAPGNDGEYRLFSYVMTAGHEMYRGWGVPGGEYGSLQDILFLEQVNMLDFMKAQWFVETTVLDELNPVKSAPREEDGEVALKSFAKKESVKKAPVVSKDMEGRDYILVPEAGDDDEKELPVTLRVGDTVYLPNTSDAGGYFIVQRIVNKDTIHVLFMQAGVPISRNVTRKEVGNKWRFYESASHIGNEIVGVDIIENCHQDKRFYVRKGDVVVAQVASLLQNVQGVYEAEGEQLVKVIGFASHEEIIAHIRGYNKVAKEEDTLRVVIHASKFDQIPEEDEA